MQRSTFLPVLASLLVVGCRALDTSLSEPAESPPNFLLVVTDDQGWGELSRRGHPFVSTPELDRMAASGLALERFYAAAPVCSPTRASLLTGRHPCRTRTFAWGHDLPGDEVTIAEVLRDQGYATGHFGKWHLGSVRDDEPTSPGAQGFTQWASTPNFFDRDPLLSIQGEVEEHTGSGTDVVTERALGFIAEHGLRGRPFLAVIWYGDPHLPHAENPQDAAEFAHLSDERANYAAELKGIDRNVGRLRRALAKLGIERDTVVWFTSDNGPRAPGEARDATGGLRDDKGTLWEGGLRVPTIVEWPGRIEPGLVSTALSGTVDVAPTLAALAGAELGGELDGVDLSELLRAPAGWRRGAGLGFWMPGFQGRAQWAERILEAIRAGERHPSETPPDERLTTTERGHAAWVEDGWKLHRRGAGGDERFELYHLASDPAESRDLARAEPVRLEALARKLSRWQTAIVAEQRVGSN